MAAPAESVPGMGGENGLSIRAESSEGAISLQAEPQTWSYRKRAMPMGEGHSQSASSPWSPQHWPRGKLCSRA